MNKQQRQRYDEMLAKPFVVRFTNFDHGLSNRFATLDEARTAGQNAGFEYSVLEQHPVKGQRLCGSYSVFGGWRDYPGSFYSERLTD